MKNCETSIFSRIGWCFAELDAVTSRPVQLDLVDAERAPLVLLVPGRRQRAEADPQQTKHPGTVVAAATAVGLKTLSSFVAWK